MRYSHQNLGLQGFHAPPQLLRGFHGAALTMSPADELKLLVGMTHARQKRSKTVFRYYWGAHLRFFRALCVTIKVPAGSQPGTVLRLKGKGAPKLGDKKNRGNHYVTMKVKIPSSLSSREKEIVEELRTLWVEK